MATQHRAKLFLNGRSQAVRLPVEFRFSAEEVYIRQDKETGDVILSERPESDRFWSSYFSRSEDAADDEARDFLAGLDRSKPKDRELF